VALSAGNLLARLPQSPEANERVDTLLDRADFRIERIVSTGQVTPAGEWYDQAADEWVLLVSGRARLEIEGEGVERELGPGDYVFLPAHCRHRVAWTDPDQATVWLAVHLAGGAQSSS
jgi:cupin 2 domain-containing protein